MTHPLDRRGGAPLRVGDGLPEFLRRTRARIDAGELGMSAEELEAQAAEDAQYEADQLAHHVRVQATFLSRRHVKAARAIMDGTAEPKEMFSALAVAVAETPRAFILMTGDTGSGKTTAATYWALRRAGEGATVRHRQAVRFRDLADSRELEKELLSVDLLIIDQLADTVPDWITGIIRGVIDERYQRELQTMGIVTAGDATEILGAEVVDRFEVELSTSEKSWRGK